MTQKSIEDQLTSHDWDNYLPSVQERDIFITSYLAMLDAPFTFERKEDGEVFVYSIKRREVELGRVILKPDAGLGFVLVDPFDTVARQEFHHIVARIRDQIALEVLYRKTYGNPLTPLQDAPPVKPEKSEPLDKWFEYYHACKKKRRRYTLEDLATDLSLSHGYVRQEHAKYIADKEDT